VQYQSIISRRRLVCSTICDSFLGDAMISSLALHFRLIGASETRASQQPNPQHQRHDLRLERYGLNGLTSISTISTQGCG
jgi:hypothetical protein